MSDWTPLRAMGTFTRRSAGTMLIETYHDGYELNETGAYIWSKVGSGRSVSQIGTDVAEHYSIPVEDGQRTVEQFLADLEMRGFVTRGNG
jgi:coenzyme PQQ synthesis protein D (PqqD)